MSDVVVVGVDAGGTKTDVCIANGHGAILGFATAGTGNWESVGVEGVRLELADAIGRALASAGLETHHVSASCFAMAGLDWPQDVDRLDPALATLGLPGPRVVLNDAFAALRAGSMHGVGVANIAGTGGVTAGRNTDGRTFRTLGQGIGEAGGAGQVVSEAVESVVRGWYGSMEVTGLTDAFLEVFQVATVEDLLEGFCRHDIDPSADHARLVFEMARKGDAVARRVLTSVGEAHGRDVLGVAKRVGLLDGGEPFDVVRAGSLHLDGEGAFDDSFRATLINVAPHAVIRSLEWPPVAGAALLALEAAGNEVDEIRVGLGREAASARFELVGG